MQGSDGEDWSVRDLMGEGRSFAGSCEHDVALMGYVAAMFVFVRSVFASREDVAHVSTSRFFADKPRVQRARSPMAKTGRFET